MSSGFSPRLTFALAICFMNSVAAQSLNVESASSNNLISNSSTSSSIQQPLYSEITKDQKSFLVTLKDLVNIESGSGDREGLDKLSIYIFNRLKALGGQVEYIEPGDASAYRMFDTPKKIGRMVKAEFTGIGTKNILLIAHMDTVYLKGMLKNQPFKIVEDRAYGLGIQDDKQGVALILHIMGVLNKAKFKEYGKITVLINADEEVSSPGSRDLIVKLGANHDATLSFEPSLYNLDLISLTTSGVGAVNLKVTGKASHAGFAPELGQNALTELAYQIQQMRDLSEPEAGIKMNWTLANAGTNRNVIPSNAEASADVRVLSKDGFDVIERKIKDRVKTQQNSDVTVDIALERRRPALVAGSEALALAEYAKKIYAELGKDLVLNKVGAGAATDASFASLNTNNPVLESMGLQGFGAHTDKDEFILISSIVPRMYLNTRLIMDFSRNKINLGK